MDDDRRPYDALYKRLFSFPEMVEALFRDAVKGDFVEDLDFSTLEKCENSYVSQELKERRDDLVWRVKNKSGGFVYLYIVLEFQSTPDPWMPLRILCYTALMWEGLVTSEAVKPGDPLPPVFPVVLYSGDSSWTKPCDMSELYANLPESLQIYQPKQRFFLLDEGHDSDKAQGNGFVSLLLRLLQVKSESELMPLFELLHQKLKDDRHKELKRCFLDLLHYSLPSGFNTEKIAQQCDDLKKGGTMLKDSILRWIEEGHEKGREEGREEGRAEGRAEGEARGRSEALMESIVNLMNYMKISVEKAMDMLRVPQAERSKLISMMSL